MELNLSNLKEAGSAFDVIATRMVSLNINGYSGDAVLEIDDERNATLTFKEAPKATKGRTKSG